MSLPQVEAHSKRQAHVKQAEEDERELVRDGLDQCSPVGLAEVWSLRTSNRAL